MVIKDMLLYNTKALAKPNRNYILTQSEYKEKMLKKWLKAFLVKPLTILKSIWFNITNVNNNLSKKRLSICNKCNKKINIKLVGDVCDECGCILDNKTRIKDEYCDLGKW